MFDFPNAPTNGQTFTPSGGPTYYWDAPGGAWRLAGGTTGAGSFLDADLLDGQHGAFYQDLTNATGLLPAANHGNLPGGTLHALATPSTAGFLTDAPNDGLTYGRKGLAWATVIGGAYTDDNPPPPPLIDGQLWYKASTGVLYVYYDDGTSTQWVQVSASPQSPNSGFAFKTARPKNLLTNPCMQISQENGNNGGTTNTYYAADQWVMGFGGFTGVSAQRSPSFVSPENSLYCISQWFTTAKASLAAGDYLQIYQPVEGQMCSELGWGTAKAVPAVLRFNAFCDQPGTFSASITSSNADYTWIGSFTCDGTQTFKTFTFAVPPQTAGTFPKDNSVALAVHFCYASGTTYQGVLGWQAGNKLIGPSQTNGAAVTGKGLVVTDVGLYADPDNTGIAPPWVPKKFDDDARDCHRYYWKGMPLTALNFPSYATGSVMAWPVMFKNLMRIAPTTSADMTGTSLTNFTSVQFDASTQHGARFLLITNVATNNDSISFAASSNLIANARM